MQGLKAAKVKEKNSLGAKSLAAKVAHLLLLADSFNFNLSFLMLLNIISNNTPVPFL